jgi:hypothetical protein
VSSAASGVQFLPTVFVPRAPSSGASLEDVIVWAKGMAAAQKQFNDLFQSQTEAFISSSAYIGDLTVVTSHIQDAQILTAKIGDLQVTTIKRQTTNAFGPTAHSLSGGGSQNYPYVFSSNNSIMMGCYPQEINKSMYFGSAGVQFCIYAYRPDLGEFDIGAFNGNTASTWNLNTYIEYW